ncbi:MULTISPECIES: secondary thiamine-phosphate synthase enzyme YjbQ [Shewanella]|uniref:Secondary thiamine-phosphate synthase enzyme YjbQ n=1 Tax=Shewanella fidelis TaxID=173509 RepID=A0AAW8NML2_9GAMM|nr:MULTISPECIES: secondary thiamine-phosphate synthase enzyme YjbQ [Shewanella]MDR8523936.1 secondary thiamine-phosphate synthase enzyme YjbQ [Shewanella fidelis]MDW4810483.1 secondary thiamine-phosphate synthase enzyme YjbQ [Shewanella fidelis]MDW4814604.1 secondary thiamine-phosphate synthase enzyme YjbQ [Shewanella fidelis]MDW4818694.1 secondary thiamine-phosphate synthase enzyme YjbQ [Shewanella fidelis]MDW4823629.1 secondary thiamine-phosphate synthase enzyme YjbQ [Shewanella fidelis]
MWLQQTISLTAKSRGFHLVTEEIERSLPELRQIKIGVAHLLLQHTSASLTLNENADPSVRADFEAYINRLAPERAPYYTHTYEGDDDMPAHLKSSLLGVSLTIPITNGRFNLGTWQGIYLGEHRDHGGKRRILVTINGE